MKKCFIYSALISDLSEIVLFLNSEKFFDFPNGGGVEENYLKNFIDYNYFLVLKSENIKGEIFGFIIGEPIKGNGILINYIFVKKELRGKNLGFILIEEFIKRAKSNKIKFFSAYIPNNKKIKNFYKKCGFNIKLNFLLEIDKDFNYE